MSKKNFSVIILAAGKGTRMASPLPKVLHPVAGKAMVHRVIDSVKEAGAKEIRVVIGHGGALVQQVVEPLGAVVHKQVSQNGTADAVKSAVPGTLEGTVMVLNGDHPLITKGDIETLLQQHEDSDSSISVVSCELNRPGSFGRIVRHKGELRAIVEAKDASADTLSIREVNTGLYILDADVLNQLLPMIENNNAQGEYYFTDIISIAQEHNIKVDAIKSKKTVAFGVNNQRQLSKATQYVYKRKVNSLLDQGVMVIDPDNTYIDDSVQIGAASVIYPGVHIIGESKIGSYCVIEPNCFVSSSQLDDSVQIKMGSHLEETQILAKAVVGPYARLRPQTTIGKEAKVGNFVEMKKVKFGDGAKASHLTYLGDAEIGEGTNIGCGTITCNYAVDKKKYKTVIGKNTFVGSDTQFVAPINVGDDAVVASGSTVTKDVPSGALAVARGKQRNIENYNVKKNKAEEKSEQQEKTIEG